jgi:hypothetical protein
LPDQPFLAVELLGVRQRDPFFRCPLIAARIDNIPCPIHSVFVAGPNPPFVRRSMMDYMCDEDRETLSWLRLELDGLKEDRAEARFGPDKETIKAIIDAAILDIERQVKIIIDRHERPIGT